MSVCRFQKNVKREKSNLYILVHFGTLKSEDCPFSCRPNVTECVTTERISVIGLK